MKKKIVFVLGIGRSGSTLLDLMIGSHSQCFSLGEISKIPQYFRQSNSAIQFCPDSSFWLDNFTHADLERLAAGLGDRRLHPMVPLKLERAVRQLIGRDEVFNPYSFLFSKINQPILVDSSKYPYWVEKRIKGREFTSGQIEAYLVHLIRDGRAVLNSYLRAFPGLTVPEFSDRWLTHLDDSLKVFDLFPANRRMQVRYEALATQTDAVLGQICDMIGVTFEPGMAEYWKHDHHHVAGSLGTRSLISKYRKQSIADDRVQQIHGDYYQNLDLAIRLDMRWPKELSEENLQAFYQLIGNRNQPYEWNEA